MAGQPLGTPFTSRELALGEYVAAILWLGSASALLGLLVWALSTR